MLHMALAREIDLGMRDHLLYELARDLSSSLELDVVLEKVIGGGHTWPGSPFGVAIEGSVGHTTMSISANEVIWQFFQAHPLHPA